MFFTDKDFLNEILNYVLDIPVVEPQAIPDIDLYMDQVTTLAEENLKLNKRNDEDKLLTKTMINNYTKAGLIQPPIKKKYSKEHILRLIMIYNLKSVLSINDIKTTFDNISDSKYMYDKFVDLQKEKSEFFKSNFQYIIDNIMDNSRDEKDAAVSAVMMLAIAANSYKQMAEMIIDKYLKAEDEGKE